MTITDMTASEIVAAIATGELTATEVATNLEHCPIKLGLAP